MEAQAVPEKEHQSAIDSIYQQMGQIEDFDRKGEEWKPENQKILKDFGHNLVDVTLLKKWFYSNRSTREALVPIAFRTFSLHQSDENDYYLKHSLLIITEISRNMKDEKFSAEQIELILNAFEKTLSASIALQKEPSKVRKGSHLRTVVFNFLNLLYLLYEQFSAEIEECVDSILVAAVNTTGVTVMDGHGTRQQTGLKLLNKISRKNPTALYRYIPSMVTSFLQDGKGNFAVMLETLSIFTYLAARNALLLKGYIDKLNTVARAINQSAAYHSISTIFSRVGRTEPSCARQCQLYFLEWIREEVDINLAPQFIAEILNVAGVYKQSLEKEDIQFLESFSRQQSDLRISDLVRKLTDYHSDSSQAYLRDAFLNDQRDLLGRLICLVDAKIDEKLGEVQTSIRDLQQRTDKVEDVLYIHQEDIERLKGHVTQIGDRVNTVEVASLLMQEQMEEMQVNLEELTDHVLQQDSEMKRFLSDVKKKLPVPYAYETRGIIRKRLVLKFRCSRGGKPDFEMETAHWNKWIKVFVLALQVSKDVASASIMSTLSDLKSLYDAFRTKGFNPEERFQTLVQQPFLTAKEEDDLIKGLRRNGFFRVFEYDPETASWFRTVVGEESPEPAVAKNSDGKTASGVSEQSMVGLSPQERIAAVKARSQKIKEDAQQRIQAAKDRAAALRDKNKSGSNNSPVVSVPQAEVVSIASSPASGYEDIRFGCFLYKVGGPFGIQRKRWFEIHGTVNREALIIYYYAEVRHGTPTGLKGRILITQLQRVTALEKGLWFNWLTQSPAIHGGKYRLRSSSFEDYRSWTSLLRRCGVSVEEA